jgi:hypothetical protein
MLTIVSRGSEDKITCSLEHVELLSSEPYTALSYCWGPEKERKTIEMDGTAVNVTPNLYAALKRLQVTPYTRVWIDALCINQDDREERAHQVRLMKYVFEGAERVVAWLGDLSFNAPLTPLGFKYSNEVSNSRDASVVRPWLDEFGQLNAELQELSEDLIGEEHG